MRRTLQFLLFLFAVLFVLSSARTASAQTFAAGRNTSKIDIFGGYSYIRANTVVVGEPISLQGGSGSLAYNLKDWFGVAADVGFYQGTVAANGLSLSIMSYQIGPRFSLRRRKRLIPFGQVLFGMGHAGGTLYTSSLGGGLPPIGTNNAFMLTVGGGADWRLTSKIGIRLIQAEYLHSQFRNGGTYGNRQDNVRLSAGVVFSFGSH